MVAAMQSASGAWHMPPSYPWNYQPTEAFNVSDGQPAVKDETGHINLPNDGERDDVQHTVTAKDEDGNERIIKLFPGYTGKPTVIFRPKRQSHVEQEIEIRPPAGVPKFHTVRYAPDTDFVEGTWYITHYWNSGSRLFGKTDWPRTEWSVTFTKLPKKHLWDKIQGTHFERTTRYTALDPNGRPIPSEVTVVTEQDLPVSGSAATWMLYSTWWLAKRRSKWSIIAYSYHRNEADDAEDRERVARGEPTRNNSVREETEPYFHGRDWYGFEGQRANGKWGGARGPTMDLKAIHDNAKLDRKWAENVKVWADVDKYHSDRAERKARWKAEAEAKKNAKKRRGENAAAADVEESRAEQDRGAGMLGADAHGLQDFSTRSGPPSLRMENTDGFELAPQLPILSGARLGTVQGLRAIPSPATLRSAVAHAENEDEATGAGGLRGGADTPLPSIDESDPVVAASQPGRNGDEDSSLETIDLLDHPAVAEDPAEHVENAAQGEASPAEGEVGPVADPVVDPAYVHKKRGLTTFTHGLFPDKKRPPEKIAWARALVQQFEDGCYKGRPQGRREDDWIIVYFDGEGTNPNPLTLNKNKGLEIYSRRREGLSQEQLTKIAAALHGHEYQPYRDAALKLKALPGHQPFPRPTDMRQPVAGQRTSFLGSIRNTIRGRRGTLSELDRS